GSQAPLPPNCGSGFLLERSSPSCFMRPRSSGLEYLYRADAARKDSNFAVAFAVESGAVTPADEESWSRQKSPRGKITAHDIRSIICQVAQQTGQIQFRVARLQAALERGLQPALNLGVARALAEEI